MSHAVFCSVLMGIDKVFLLVVVDVISIHAPLAGCDALLRPPGNRRAKRRFQSTPPLRGATLQHIEIQCNGQGISIHAPLAGCDERIWLACAGLRISIHAPLAGCDVCQYNGCG